MMIALNKITLVSLLACLLLLFQITACCKKYDPPPRGDMLACHREIEWNEVNTRDALIGVWQWEYSGIVDHGEGQYVLEYEWTVEFKSDSTLIVMEHDSIINETRWTIIPDQGGLFTIHTEAFVGHLQGQILNCGNLIELDGSSSGLAFNFFRRIG